MKATLHTSGREGRIILGAPLRRHGSASARVPAEEGTCVSRWGERSTIIETIATGRSAEVRARLRRVYGGSRWRQLKGKAVVRLQSGRTRRAEIHWCEAHGVGRKEAKITRFLA